MTADSSDAPPPDQSLRDANDARARLAEILDNADDAIISTDERLIVSLFNRGAERIFGYIAAEVVGQSLNMLLPLRSTDKHEKYVRDFGASDVRSRRMAERGAVAGRRKDGSEFPAEVSISKASSEHGFIYTAILRDISAHIAAEEALRDRNRRLRLALSAGQMGMFELDGSGRTIARDETARHLLGLQEITANSPPQDFYDRVHPDDRAEVRARVEGFLQGQTDASVEYRVILPDGTIRWIAAHAAHEGGRHGQRGSSVGVVRDITERKNIELTLEARVAERTVELRNEIERREEIQADLLRSQKLQAVGELAGGMAHDFNNLLTIITGNLELLGFRHLDDKASDLVRRAQEAAKMGGRLANRLLVIGRRQRLQPVTLNLNEVARSMTDVLRRTLGDQIEIRTTFADDLWPARIDISEVENTILNLAINARDAMPRGGTLHITTSNKSLGPDDVAGETGLKPGDYVMLTVNDTGIGIPPEIIPRVFEPYFTTKEAGRGTGLGLSTIYGFAKQSGGHVTIYSEVGKGTSVRLYLPRAATAGEERERARPSPKGAPAGETVLVVDDNPDVRDVTVKRLDMLGYHVIIAENGPAAIAALKANDKIDLVFSDIVMPGGMSGFDLVNWVRANRPKIKVLLTSGFTGEIAKNGENAADDIEVLRKPYALADLARAVREALS